MARKPLETTRISITLFFNRPMMEEKYRLAPASSPSTPGTFRRTIHIKRASRISGIANIQEAVCQAIAPIMMPNMAGPTALPMLPPMPCSERASPRLDANRYDSTERADGCHRAMLVPTRIVASRTMP